MRNGQNRFSTSLKILKVVQHRAQLTSIMTSNTAVLVIVLTSILVILISNANNLTIWYMNIGTASEAEIIPDVCYLLL